MKLKCMFVMRGFRFSRRWEWRCRSSGLWRRVDSKAEPNVSETHNVSIFRVCLCSVLNVATKFNKLLSLMIRNTIDQMWQPWWWHLHLHIGGSKVAEYVGDVSSRTLVSTYTYTRYYSPQDQHRHLHSREPQISQIFFLFSLFSFSFVDAGNSWRARKHIRL